MEIRRSPANINFLTLAIETNLVRYAQYNDLLKIHGIH